VKPQIEAAGFRLAAPVMAEELGAKPHTILRQSPLPGHKVSAGAEIVLTIAK
jgi:beta-lactam-binding protein with PASTA domain